MAEQGELRGIDVAQLFAVSICIGLACSEPADVPGMDALGARTPDVRMMVKAGSSAAGAKAGSSPRAAGAAARETGGGSMKPERSGMGTPSRRGGAASTGTAGGSAADGLGAANGLDGQNASPPPPDRALPGPGLRGSCPDGFSFSDAVLNDGGTVTDFDLELRRRQFVVRPANDMATPRPVLVVITGTIESTLDSIDRMPADLAGAFKEENWFVLAPVRACSIDAADSSTRCESAGTDGWLLADWNSARTSRGNKWENAAGPDADFIKAMVLCAATQWPLDATRLFVTGVSAGGGTMTYRLLTFQDDFWAGGVAESGVWHFGSDLQEERALVEEDPMRIVAGRCCRTPLPTRMAPLLVASVWGGETDRYSNLIDARPSTQVASNYFSSLDAVGHVACSGNYGHRWQPAREFNTWLAELLYAHPKGSTTGSRASPPIELPDGPSAPVVCAIGRYTDHY